MVNERRGETVLSPPVWVVSTVDVWIICTARVLPSQEYEEEAGTVGKLMGIRPVVAPR
jgi:hypothetical protein